MAKKLIRKTITGSEYWDTEAKRTLFIPKGQKYDFKVESNTDNTIGGVDLTTSEDMTVTTDDGGINIEDMTVKQLYEFAEQIEVEIPKDITKKDDIIGFLSEQ